MSTNKSSTSLPTALTFAQTLPLSLYIHLPWCIQKCPYCDFNSYALNQRLPENQYVDVLLQDLDANLALCEASKLQTIFIGGGTPSLFSADSLDRLLTGIRKRFTHLQNETIEITLEANPGTVEQQRFNDYAQIGINRLSIGVQSFNDAALKRLGRIHSAADAIKAVEIAKSAGFASFNLDLMYGLPEQTLALAKHDLQQAIKLEPDHISWYHLTLEPNTPFYRQPPRNLPNDSVLEKIEMQGFDLLADHGFDRYEISAFAKPNSRCQHNLNYWRFGDYLGIGAGAHGKITQTGLGQVLRLNKYRSPYQYLREPGRFTAQSKNLSASDLRFEFMLNALRLTEGVPTSLFSERTGLSNDWLIKPVEKAVKDGLMVDNPTQLAPTTLGLRYLNDLILYFAD